MRRAARGYRCGPGEPGSATRSLMRGWRTRGARHVAGRCGRTMGLVRLAPESLTGRDTVPPVAGELPHKPCARRPHIVVAKYSRSIAAGDERCARLRTIRPTLKIPNGMIFARHRTGVPEALSLTLPKQWRAEQEGRDVMRGLLLGSSMSVLVVSLCTPLQAQTNPTPPAATSP